MKSIFETVIRRGGYDLADMLRRIDEYHIAGKLSDTDRDGLYSLARGGADAMAGVDVAAKLAEFERRIAALEKGANTGEGDSTAEYPEYIAGKWYYTGDRITYGGKQYVCAAPDGQVCTWSPDEYPAYWTEEE